MKLPQIQRRVTKAIKVGNVQIGHGAPVVIQSMTNTQTADIDSTVAQVNALANAGAQIVRVATPTPADTQALSEIVRQSPVPIVADVHFHFQRAIDAINAGVAKIRLNPGNITDRDKVRDIINLAQEKGTAIRIGVNEGSVSDRRDKAQFALDMQKPLVDLMLEKMSEYLTVFDQLGFENLALSAKSHDAFTTIAVSRALSDRWDYPLHLGVTHAGTAQTGAIRSAAALGTLLAEGIGDTIRISYAGDPVAEVLAAKELLSSLRLRPRDQVELIACPTCGRLQMDLTPIVDQVEAELAKIRCDKPVKVALMGCVVNGPGEADNADIAICAGAGKAVLFVKGKRVKNVLPNEILQTVLDEVHKIISE